MGKERTRIAGTEYDRRKKLTDEQKAEIYMLREVDGLSTYRLAEMFGVSRRTIDFVLNPDRLERVKAQTSERAKDGRYRPDTATATENVRRTREYKRQLKIEGKI